jgi:hypothetical protein
VAVRPGVRTARSGYDAPMTENQNRPVGEPSDAERDLAEHERPDVGLIRDEDLPEDLRPSDENPLAKDADDTDEAGPSAPA